MKGWMNIGCKPIDAGLCENNSMEGGVSKKLFNPCADIAADGACVKLGLGG
jgi:hypothetical protein